MPTLLIDARSAVTQPGGWAPLSPIDVAVHHTVTTAPSVFVTEGAEMEHIRAIDAYHVAQGFGGFGYHAIAFPSGRAYLCGDLNGARAHVLHRNQELRGVALAGTFTDSLPSAQQLAAARAAVAACRADAPTIPIRGHRQWALPDGATACPGNRFAEWVPGLAEEDDMTPDDVRRIINEELAAAINAGKSYNHDTLIRAAGDDELWRIEVLAEGARIRRHIRSVRVLSRRGWTGRTPLVVPPLVLLGIPEGPPVE